MANQNLNLVLSHYGRHSDQNFLIEVRFHFFLWSNIPEIKFIYSGYLDRELQKRQSKHISQTDTCQKFYSK